MADVGSRIDAELERDPLSDLQYRVDVVLVNYRGAADTIECLETLLRSEGVAVRAIVCDNASGDGSLDRIEAWARGEEACAVAAGSPHVALSSSGIPKPVRCVRVTAEQAAAGGVDAGAALVLVDAGRNGGFAAGNNAGLALCRADGRAGWVWLLNNDTVVGPGTLRAVVDRAAATGADATGCVVAFYHRPEVVQVLGGARLVKPLGLGRNVCSGAERAGLTDADVADAESRMDSVSGAAMLLSRDALERVGWSLDEGYFLFFEELDLTQRLRQSGGARLSVAGDAVVFHKAGGATRDAGVARGPSALSEFYSTRSRLRFVRRHMAWWLPTVWLAAGALAARHAVRGHGSAAWATARAMFGARRY